MPPFAKLGVGDVRPSQVIHTFGIGAIVDLPNVSAMVMGLEEWERPTPQTEIVEPRLLGLVLSHLGPQVQRLVTPPVTAGGGRQDPPCAGHPPGGAGAPLPPPGGGPARHPLA